MPALESIKKLTEKATGWARPKKAKLNTLVQTRKPNLFRFKDDGIIPNHPTFPLILYRGAVRFPDEFDRAAVFEDVFDKNGWGDSWRNGIYDYVHYHSKIHEVLGIARGNGSVQFGGKRGRILKLKAGDVAVLPAGTGHQCLSATKDFLVVGAYPRSQNLWRARQSVRCYPCRYHFKRHAVGGAGSRAKAPRSTCQQRRGIGCGL